MNITIKNNKASTEAFAKRLFYLLWQASGVYGMGIFQDRGHQEEEEIWKVMMNQEDYFGPTSPKPKGVIKVDADYVAGRMMKTYFDIFPDRIEVSNRFENPAGDYQSWASRYKKISDAVKETAKELQVEVEITS